MALMTSVTLGALAAENPRAVRVFEKHQIDFCCGGDRPVDEACRVKGISAAALLAEVEATPPAEEERDWQRASLSKLANHIVRRHHAYLREELPALAQMIEKVISAHSANHSDSLGP
jgi:regulator of cell morphogenesis and NO signaling